MKDGGVRVDHVYGPNQIQSVQETGGTAHFWCHPQKHSVLLQTAQLPLCPRPREAAGPFVLTHMPALGTPEIHGQSTLPGCPMSPVRTSNLT